MYFIILIIKYLKVIYIENNKDLIICIYINIGLFIKSGKFNSLKSIYLVLEL
jgi:hypothetical protein